MILNILLGVCVLGYIYLYVSNRRYLVRDGFQNSSEGAASAESASEIYPPPAPVLSPSRNASNTLPATFRPMNAQLPLPSKDKPKQAPPNEAVEEGFWGAGNGPLATDASGKHTNTSLSSYMNEDGAKMYTDVQKQEDIHPVFKVDMTQAGVPIPYQERPYETKPINDLDDYEYNLVFQNESDRALSTGLRQKLMSQRPMDWAGLPPSSSEFKKGMDEMQKKDEEKGDYTTLFDSSLYNSITGKDMIPPDTASIEAKERQILQSYVPKNKGATTYSVEDANTLIKSIYDTKGLIPTVAHKEGTNVWQITNTLKKNAPIVYEDETYAPATNEPNKGLGEATINVPSAATDMAASVDKFYDTNGRTRTGKWDYQEWTPGLERMFAPTEPRKNWY